MRAAAVASARERHGGRGGARRDEGARRPRATSASSARTGAASTASRPGRTRVEDWLADDGRGLHRAGGAGTSAARCSSPRTTTSSGSSTATPGVVVATGGNRVAAAFERRGEIVELSPSRLAAVETVYAMTIHKSQGSQFGTAAVLLPPATSPILTRELLYTAVTRAQERLIVVGAEATIRAAVGRPAARASGLRDRLWHPVA